MNNTIRMIVLSSLTATLGLLSLPLPSMADREIPYTSCAELQKVLNYHNSSLSVRGFEKVRMERRQLDSESHVLFCNGGIVKDGDEGTICRGHIAYYFERRLANSLGGVARYHDGIARYYASWGKTDGSPNSHNTG